MTYAKKIIKLNFVTASEISNSNIQSWSDASAIFMVSSNVNTDYHPIQKLYWLGTVQKGRDAIKEKNVSRTISNLTDFQRRQNLDYNNRNSTTRYYIQFLYGTLMNKDCNINYKQIAAALELRYMTEDGNIKEDYDGGDAVFEIYVDGIPYERFNITYNEEREAYEYNDNDDIYYYQEYLDSERSKKGFEYAEPFSSGFAVVKTDNKFGFIDQSGEIAIAAKYDYASGFPEGLAFVKSGNETMFINKNGEVVIRLGEGNTQRFSEGLAAYKHKDKVYESGKVVIGPLDGRNAYNFHEGMARYNKTGKTVIIPSRYEIASYFYEGMAAIFDKECWVYGYINKSGKIIIKPQFDKVTRFSEELACVRIHGFWRHIDKNGQFI